MEVNPNLVNALAIVGTLAVTRLVFSFVSLCYETFLRPSISLKKYGAGRGFWAVVTGASDGIGKEFAIQLAQKKFNVVLISRSAQKLAAVEKEIKDKFPETKTLIIPLDFTKATPADFDGLKKTFDTLEIGVLVNNVGTAHEIPTPFAEESMEVVENIINVNVRTQLRITSTILPQMIGRKKGLILNVGSATGVYPTGLLSVYSGSKAFLQFWSQALATEVKGSGVHVELLNTFFVTTNLSKIRRASMSTPTPKNYVKAALSRAGQNWFETPFWSHALAYWTMEEFVPHWVKLSQNYDLHMSIRKRALKKREREANIKKD
ncbi:hypothetical protein HK098_005271 [Nowakowskiella sp. JEL0407]|nr:hypothetical protein HK098_005271 [Nowakowskiella sp. JEL0407]